MGNNRYLIDECFGWLLIACLRIGSANVRKKNCWSENGLQLSFVILNFATFYTRWLWVGFLPLPMLSSSSFSCAVQIFITLLWICHHKWKRLFLWPAFKYLKFVLNFSTCTFSVIVFHVSGAIVVANGDNAFSSVCDFERTSFAFANDQCTSRYVKSFMSSKAMYKRRLGTKYTIYIYKRKKWWDFKELHATLSSLLGLFSANRMSSEDYN